MENIEGFVRSAANALGVELFPAQTDAFQKYMKLLVSWNEKMNLTAITEPRDIVIKHFADSLTILSVLDVPDRAAVLDVGTGAGFPGVPLKIAKQGIELTLMDSQQKRLTFLKEVCEKIRIRADLVHARAEDAGHDKKMRMKFDLVTARAVAPLPVLCEYCMPFVKKKGYFVAMKGPAAQDEIAQAQKAVKELGCELQNAKELSLMDGSKRTLIIFQRVTGIPVEYPRSAAKIKAKPLS